jgi:hypothetical protein
MLHALLDQIQYDPALANFAQDQLQLRLSLVNHLNLFVMNGRIEWPGDMSITEWQDKFRQNKEQGDHVLLLLAAEVFFRPIILVPACPEETQTRIEPQGVSTSVQPLYMMYFSESRYSNGHYQSIRPLEPADANEGNPQAGSTSVSMDFGSLISLPDLSLPQLQSTTLASNPNESLSRPRRPRDLSYLDMSNIVEYSRKRSRKD